jgi:FkbH-like protein
VGKSAEPAAIVQRKGTAFYPLHSEQYRQVTIITGAFVYETEVNGRVESVDQIPPEIARAFAASKETVSLRTVLPWGEHCTECVWPTCYTTCDLYEARPDGNCRRFVDGMVRINAPDTLSGYLLKIKFKQWAKLWTFGNIHLHEPQAAAKLENRDLQIGKAIQRLLMPIPARTFLIHKRYSLKKRAARAAKPSDKMPSSFMLECYNPAEKLIQLSLTVRSGDPLHKIPFQALLDLKPGFSRIHIPVAEINTVVPLQKLFNLELIPNNVPDGTTLYVGMMEFVWESLAAEEKTTMSDKPAKLPKVKVVVWDLDNTLWDGILVEDGAAKLRLKPGVREVIEELDRRGILQSIASKNNHDEALSVLKSWKLDEYFLRPQISWQPKSESISAIIRQLNIGADTVLFIDDSSFELEQVGSMHPTVRLLKAEEWPGLLAKPELAVPVTEESATRRKMYQMENQRQAVAEGFGDDYKAFLKHCAIQVTLRPMTSENLDRVHELTQRTNQMNFSGNRYDRARLIEVLRSPHLDTFVIKCEDKFGTYGVVGFAIVDSREPRLTDLMFSCRIQAKRVEHAVLSHIISKYTSETRKIFYANYKKTPRNEPSGRVFDDMGFRESGTLDGTSLLVVTTDTVAPPDGVIQIVESSASVPA